MIANNDTKTKKTQNTKTASTKQDIYMDDRFYRFNNMHEKLLDSYWLRAVQLGNNPSILIGQ